MSTLLALDVAILPPPDVGERAVRLSATLPTGQFQGLRLDANRLPHITLTQQFVRRDELGAIFERLDEALRGQPAITLPAETLGQRQESHALAAVERWSGCHRSPAAARPAPPPVAS